MRVHFWHSLSAVKADITAREQPEVELPSLWKSEEAKNEA